MGKSMKRADRREQAAKHDRRKQWHDQRSDRTDRKRRSR
jgi:hypothetical protein